MPLRLEIRRKKHAGAVRATEFMESVWKMSTIAPSENSVCLVLKPFSILLSTIWWHEAPGSGKVRVI